MNRRGLSVISLFSGAMGLDLGLEQAGFQVRVAVECNKYAAETIRRNRPDVPIIERRIEDVTTAEILEVAGLRQGEPVLVAGGPSCVAFSTAGQRGSLSDPRGVMFREFLRVVRETRPEFFVMENVKGVLSAAIRHRPLKERGPGYPPLSPDEELGSAFVLILKELQATGYYTIFDVLNSADFGAPQVRERVLFIGSRDGRPLLTPVPTHAKDPINGESRWATLRQALRRLGDPEPEYKEFPPSTAEYIKLVPEGGNWRDLPERLQAKAMGKAYVSWGGRAGFFRRLSWRKPSPSLTTSPTSKATLLCHPTEDRPLSLREYARIQQFPDDWEFSGGLGQQYTQVGNAVPVCIGRVVGEAIRKARRRRKKESLMGTVSCANEDLLGRMASRPLTMLNPARMRKVKDPEAAREWLDKHEKRSRSEFLKILNRDGNGQEPKRAETDGHKRK
jgi:DNA (cytosine-5)-methyltransferase 1